MPHLPRFLVCAFLLSVAALRAQVTETPYTIRPGSFNARIDAITVGFNRDTTEKFKFTALGLASTLISAGLTDTVDMQLGAQFFLRETYQYKGMRETKSGLGRVSVRSKWTFWQDPQLGAAAAVIPYVTIPTNKNVLGTQSPEGGVIVPYSLDLGSGFRAGAMAEWDLQRNDDDTGYDSRLFASGVFQSNLTSFFGLYGEATVAVSSASSSSFAGTLGGGATFNVTKTLQFDFNVSRGLGNRATDWVNVLRIRWDF